MKKATLSPPPSRKTPPPSAPEARAAGGLDPRVNAVRPDLADAALDGAVDAAQFVIGTAAHCRVAATPLLQAAAPSATQVSELLMGEAVTVFDSAGGWAWVQCAHDRYVGYVAADALAAGTAALASHRVVVPATHLYPEPSVKARPLSALYAGTAVSVDSGRRKGAFVAAGGGWVAAEHIAPLAHRAPDPVAVAERFLGAPYLWGGRSVRGLDCSGLVQVALALAGIAAPRDTDMQATVLGRDIGRDIGALKRGDLVFFPSHVGLMVDESHLIHANATHMAVTVDPLVDVISWVARQHEPAITALKRLA